MFLIFQWLVLVIYAISTVFYWQDFINHKSGENKKAQKWFITAVSANFLQIIYFIVETGRIPIATVDEAIGTFVWITATLYLAIEFKLKERSQGALILSVILLFLLKTVMSPHTPQEIAPILYDIKFELHVFAMLLGYSGFTLSAMSGILHLLLYREIQKKELGIFFRRLPSLAYFERISDFAINFGLIFSTLGFALGFYFATIVWTVSFYLDPKIITVLITSLIYFTYFIGRKLGAIRGQRAALLSVVGFILILFSFLIVSQLIPGAHQF